MKRIQCTSLLLALFWTGAALGDGAVSCEQYRKLACPGGKTYPIHLTFDDGPRVGTTAAILDALKKHNVKATFFVVGDRLEHGAPLEHFRMIRRIRAEGHLLGSHSYHHDFHTKLSEEQIRDYIKRSRSVGRSEVVDGQPLGDYLSPVFRLPYGDGWINAKSKSAKNALLMKVLKEAGFQHIGWDVASWDWDSARQKDPGILAYTLKQVCKVGGGVVLMHDIQKNTAAHLDEWLTAMECLGHKMVPLEYFVKVAPDGQATESCGSADNGTGSLRAFLANGQQVARTCESEGK